MNKPVFPYKHGDIQSGNWQWAIGAESRHGNTRPLCIAVLNSYGARAAGYDCETLANRIAAAINETE